jgi:membrane-associated protease RseP (regulator of RpoE activity)
MGKLMTAPEKAYPTVKSNLEKVFQDRFLIIFQETLQGQPFFALVPNPYSDSAKVKQPQEKLTRPGMALTLLLLTILTTTIIGAEINGVQVSELKYHPELIFQGLPYSLCLIAILGVHELSHYLFAVYYQIRTTLPYFIPIPFFLGTFGAFISIKSPMPNRKAVFDVAIAGPIGGFLVTIPVLIWGLVYSDIVPMPPKMNMLNFEALDPRFSLLFAVISKIALGSKLVADQAIALHPVAVAGYIGLIITALNLMPVGQLDGGHMVHAMFGQGKALIIGQITRILVIMLAVVRGEFLLWAIILIFMPVTDQPALNDVSELDNGRDFLGLLALVLLIVILLPLPPTVAQWLNI